MVVNEFDGSISLKTPYNDEVFALYHQEDYSRDQLRGFKRHVQLKYSRTQNIIIDTNFGTKPKLFGIMEIKMPVRGYETVKLSFKIRYPWSVYKLKSFQSSVLVNIQTSVLSFSFHRSFYSQPLQTCMEFSGMVYPI
jgi:hypothetical protein